jgi:vacuolar-type H+-ATPase subunit I/STV1
MNILKRQKINLSLSEKLTISLFMAIPPMMSLLLLVTIVSLFTGPKVNEEIRHLELEIEKIDHPVNAVLIDKESTLDFLDASTHESYYLNRSLEEIGKYYQEIFEKQGWIITKTIVYSSEHAVWGYCKGEYSGSVEYYNYGLPSTYSIWMNWGNTDCTRDNRLVIEISIGILWLFLSLLMSIILGIYFYNKFAYKNPDIKRRLLPIL